MKKLQGYAKKTLNMTDEHILEEAIRLVEEGVSVTLPVRGNSMLPFIIGGKESVILGQPTDLQVGDVVLAWVEGGRYVVHRIIHLKGEQVTLMGDGNLEGTERCLIADVKAKATHVVNRQGQHRYLYAYWRSIGARLWFFLLPFRRYLLAIYRRTIL